MMNWKKEVDANQNLAGLFTLVLRLVIGWTYFSALWRRLILANKLDPDLPGYLGIKFNHFLPNALGIKPIIEYLVSNPDLLHIAMIAFTVIEGIVGLFLMLGGFTRLMGIGVFSLAMGILLGSGWLGTTCVDEWQIGVLGLAGGFTMFLTGSGAYSLDNYFLQKKYKFTDKKWFSFLGSGLLPIRNLQPKVLVGSLLILGMTLFTNQVFHGGLWGDLHNMSKAPIVEISNTNIENNALTFQVYRVEGVDVYGSFLIGIHLLNAKGEILKSLDMKALSSFPVRQISNYYVAKVHSGVHSLILPLGARADITLNLGNINPALIHTIKLVDISGAEWEARVN